MCRACGHESRRTAVGNVRRDSSLREGTLPASVVVGLGAVQPGPQAGGSTKVTSSSIMERSSAWGDGARRPRTARSAGYFACTISQLSCHCQIMCLLKTRRDLWTGMQIGPPLLGGSTKWARLLAWSGWAVMAKGLSCRQFWLNNWGYQGAVGRDTWATSVGFPFLSSSTSRRGG